MSTRLTALFTALAALALAPAALADAGAAAPAEPITAAAPAAATAVDPAVDPVVLGGKIDALAEQYAETKAAVSSMQKLKFSGYLQARWGWSEAASYNTEAGKSTPVAPGNQGFTIRRGRLKSTYDADWSQYVLQIDVVPSGVAIKEGYATIKLPAGFALDAGLQLFPFGYEVYGRSSSDLDTLERSAVTRAFLDGEYDLGLALRGKLSIVNFKVGVFNGNGIKGNSNGLDNDQLKDVIGRATVDLGILTAGVSGWYGKSIAYASAADQANDRLRAAVDAQLFLDLLPIGGTAVKGEFIWGRNAIGGTVGAGTDAARIPTGHGWYGTVVQNVGQTWQVAARYEQYVADNTLDVSPAGNTKVKSKDELQLALHAFVGSGLKLTGAWFHPMNGEKGDAAAKDPKADQFIVQAQAKF